MKTKILLIIVALVFASLIVFAIKGMTEEQKNFYVACKKNCSLNQMLETRQCNNVSNLCRDDCTTHRANCSIGIEDTYKVCTDTCKNSTFNESKNILRRLLNSCKHNCSRARVESKRECYAEYRDCNKVCHTNKWQCKKERTEVYKQCQTDCEVSALAYNVTNQTQGEKIFCPRMRPDVCTDEYDPVCSNRNQTYSNACVACMDRKVNWYIRGACDAVEVIE